MSDTESANDRYEVNLQVAEVVTVELDAEHAEAAILEAIDRVESGGKHVTRLLTAAEKGSPVLSDGDVREHESFGFFRDLQDADTDQTTVDGEQ